MKVIKQTETQLILREQPWLILAISGWFLFFGIFGLAIGSLWSILPIVISLLSVLIVGNISICSFDKSLNRMTLTRKWFKKELEVIEHSLDEISDVEVEVKRSTIKVLTSNYTNRTRNYPTRTRNYRVSLLLRGGKRVPLTTSYTGGIGHPQTEEAIALQIRQFLNLR